VIRFEARPGSALADEVRKLSYEVTRIGESTRFMPNDIVEVIAATCRPSSSGPGPKPTSVLLLFAAQCQLASLAGSEHGRTIPLADLDQLSRRHG
jgi:hypothetical protein